MLTMLWMRPGTVRCRLFCSGSPIRSLCRNGESAGKSGRICPPGSIGWGTNAAPLGAADGAGFCAAADPARPALRAIVRPSEESMRIVMRWSFDSKVQ